VEECARDHREVEIVDKSHDVSGGKFDQDNGMGLDWFLGGTRGRLFVVGYHDHDKLGRWGTLFHVDAHKCPTDRALTEILSDI
jgi:hypothetical protein